MSNIFQKFERQIEFARSKLGTLADGSGTLIGDHAVRVFALLVQVFETTGRLQDQNVENILMAALFHDLLEDTNTTEEELINLSNTATLELVREMTITFEGKTIEEAVAPMYQRSEASFLIKLADICDNFGKSRFVLRSNNPKFFNDFFLPLLSCYEKYIAIKKLAAGEYKKEIDLMEKQVAKEFSLLKQTLELTRFL